MKRHAEPCLLAATGNRFALRDACAGAPLDEASLAARELCAELRLDGLLVVAPPEKGGDVRMLVFNADGTRAEACGNGLRCVAKLAVERGYARGDELVIETDAGLRSAVVRRTNGRVVAARCAMGTPRIAPRPIALELDGREHEAWTVDMGNPHCVLLLDGVQDAPVARWGPAIERHASFPARINAVFAALRPTGLEVRVFERGVGETLSCGTGASAAAAVALRAGRLFSPVEVRTRGGVLEVDWDGRGELFLAGGVARCRPAGAPGRRR